MHIHILGICGTFMGSLALLAREAGHVVTGADQNVYPPMSDQLINAGIELHQGYDAEHIARLKPDSVVIGNALSRGNPSVEYVLDQGLSYQSGPAWLAEHVLHDRWVLAVAGTHGKTSTASMLAWILEHQGLAPGFLIGGVPGNFGLSARLGDSQYFVIEADEYDTAFFDKRSKFVHYHPKTLVLNNLEFDHADIFEDLAAIQKQFHHLIRTVPASGRVLMPAEAALQQVIDMGCWSQLEYLTGKQSAWRVETQANDQSAFELSRIADAGADQNVGQVSWPLCGAHNQSNGLAAIAAANHIGVSAVDAAQALSGFKSVKRRMELLATVNGVSVYDDFAHHPSAIKTTLEGLRARYPQQRIMAIIEPRSNTMRMGCHHDVLADAVKEADRVLWFEPDALVTGGSASDDLTELQKIFNGSSDNQVFNNIESIIAEASQYTASGDQIVIMSNGGFAGIHHLLIDALQ